jgi:hypothetical protein
MRDERTPAEQDDRNDRVILGLLLDSENQRPWADDEVAREFGDPIDTVDSLARLHAAGLVHQLDGFVWATRAALESNRLKPVA